MRNVSDILVREIETHILFSVTFFFQNPAIYVIMWKNCCLLLKATDDNATHAHYKLLTQGYKLTLIAFPPQNCYKEAPTATLHAQSLSCSHYNFLPEKAVEFVAACSERFIWIVLVLSLCLFIK